MNQIESRSEPASITTINRFESNRLSEIDQFDAEVVKAASLLLGIELRSWLSNRDRDHIDNLAPNNAIAFLVHGRTYLHPKEIELFPMDLIEAAINQGGDAIFSHRWESARTDGPTASRVYTGMIGYLDGEPLVLGMFGPDDPVDRTLLESRFEHVISVFRAARPSAESVIESLTPSTNGTARLLVNRASGRVVHVDNAICEYLDREPDSFVSREYSMLDHHIRRLVGTHRMKMENLCGGCLNLTCISFTPMPRKNPNGAGTDAAILNAMRSEMAAITSAAEYIESQADNLDSTDITDLAARIADTGHQINRRLARRQLLNNFENLSAENTNALYDLERAVDRFNSDNHGGITFTVDSDSAVIDVNAPREAFRLLFESVLETHRLAPGNIGQTTVRAAAAPEPCSTRITFKTVLPGTMRLADLERVWRRDTEQVAEKLGANVDRKLLLESNTILTHVTIPTAKETQE